MGKYINQVKSVSEEYTCIQCLEFNFCIIHQEFNENYLNNVKKLVSISDVVLCSTILSEPRLKVYNSILQCAGSKCRIIHIPIIDQFRGYYPQFAVDGGKHELPYTDIEKSLFYRRDGLIISCCKRGITLNETKEIANSDHAFDNDMVESCMKFFIKLLKILDSLSDIKMFDNFLNNYQTNLLFLNPGHISTFWAKKYISVISSNIMGFNVRTSEVENINIPSTDLNRFSQAPIYPQVSNKLGLKFNNSDRKYILRYDGKKVNEVSFDEYIEILYDYYNFLIKFDVTSF